MVKLSKQYKDFIERRVRSVVPEADVVDVEALWDSTLSFHENVEGIGLAVGVPIYSKSEVDRLESGVGAEAERYAVQGERFREDVIKKGFNNFFDKAVAECPLGKELIDELEAFNPFLLRPTLSTLTVCASEGVAALTIGGAGLGKTRSSCEFLSLLGEPFERVQGHWSPSDLCSLLSSSNTVVCINEALSVLKNQESVNLLLGVLESNQVEWRGQVLPCKAKIILNVNHVINSSVMAALESRCITTRINLTSSQVLKKLDSRASYEPQQVLWNTIAGSVHRKTVLSESELSWIRGCLQLQGVDDMRDESKLIAVARACKAVFGSAYYAVKFIEYSPIAAIIASELERAEKVRLLMSQGVSRRSAYRWLKPIV